MAASPSTSSAPTRPDPPVGDGASSLLDRAELAVGRAQFSALRRALARAAALRRSRATIVHPRQVAEAEVRITMPYLHRGIEPQRPGTPILLLHGFGADKETWLMQTLVLPRRRPMIVVDLPGFGQASPIPGALASPAAQSEAVQCFLDALGLQRVHLVGNSMGGGLALRLAHDAPERIASMALLNAIGPEVPIKSETMRGWDHGENHLIPRDAAGADKLAEVVMARPPKLPRAMIRYATSKRVAMSERLQELFEGWTSSPAADDLPGDLGALDIPALVVCGERDRVIHPETSRAIARALPRAELHSMAEIGHMPQLEAPRRTARLLTRLWADLD
ncbi:MAG: alpha/beta fold hydrolase [Myxococcota bacterium]